MSAYVLLLTHLLFLRVMCELFVTGIRKREDESTNYLAGTCKPLQEQASLMWIYGVIVHCEYVGYTEMDQHQYDGVYRITVNPNFLNDYHESMRYTEIVALVNAAFNREEGLCSTVTGSGWLNSVNKADTTFTFMAHYPSGTAYANCANILSIAHHSLQGQALRNCHLHVSEKQVLDNTRRSFVLTVKADHTLRLLSLGIFKELSSITHVINYGRNLCTAVNSVSSEAKLHALILRIKVVQHITSENFCDWFVWYHAKAYDRGPFHNCSFISKIKQQRSVLFKIYLNGWLDNLSLQFMSNLEIAMHTESLFNADVVGCMSYNQTSTMATLQKTNKPYYSYLSGPPGVDICHKVIEYYGYNYAEMFSKCEKVYGREESILHNQSLYRLSSAIPTYMVDFKWYTDLHSKMIYELNKKEKECIYNGFVLRETDLISATLGQCKGPTLWT